MEEPREERINLATVANGAALELFDRELALVLANIADINTSALEVREISIKVRFHPDESRQAAETSLVVKSKLSGVKPVKKPIFLGTLNGQYIAVQNNPRQSRLFDPAPSTRDMNAVARQIEDAHDR